MNDPILGKITPMLMCAGLTRRLVASRGLVRNFGPVMEYSDLVCLAPKTHKLTE